MSRFHYLKNGARLWRNRCRNYVYVIICVSICCDQIRKNMRKKFKKQTHETHERHETHMVKLYILLSSLILRKGREKINKFRKTHERHETHRQQKRLNMEIPEVRVLNQAPPHPIPLPQGRGNFFFPFSISSPLWGED